MGGGNFSQHPLRTSPARGKSSEKGWVQTVEQELGISNQTAYRLMEKAIFLRNLHVLSEGRPIKYLNSVGVEAVVEPTGDRPELARRAIESVIAGESNAHRALVGVIGESDRRASQGKQRKDPDYADLGVRSAKTLRNAFLNWDQFGDEQRRAIVQTVADIVGMLPRDAHQAILTGVEAWPEHEKKLFLNKIKKLVG
jgi:hypothetical protein